MSYPSLAHNVAVVAALLVVLAVYTFAVTRFGRTRKGSTDV